MSTSYSFTWICLLSLALVQVKITFGDSNIFVMTPSSINTTSMAVATFECMGRGVDSVGWYVNDEYVRDRHDIERNITFLNKWDSGVFHSVLIVHAIPVNNGSKVECATFTYGEGERKTSSVYLLIQDPPAADEDTKNLPMSGKSPVHTMDRITNVIISVTAILGVLLAM